MSDDSNMHDYLKRQPDAATLKKLTWAAWVVSGLIFALVSIMMRPGNKLDVGVDFSFLPMVHAVLNSLVAVFLVIAVLSVKNKNIVIHKRAIGVAVLLSALFLLCYVMYHSTVGETLYGDINGDNEVSTEEEMSAGGLRYVYYAVLASHIILAAVSLPFILITLSLGYTNHFARHKKMARWVFPLWLYVAATGPVCYLLLRPYY